MSSGGHIPIQTRPIAIAPTANRQPLAHDGGPAAPSMPYTCVTCAKRKVKCDKAGPPCSTCRKGRHQCYYEAPAPRKRKRKAEDDVQERLEQYESLLKQHGLIKEPYQLSPEKETPYHVSNGATSMGRSTPEPSTGRLLAGRGKSRYLDSTLWRNLADEELNPSSDEDDEREDVQAPAVRSVQDPVSAAMFGAPIPAQSLVDLHPTYEDALKLWSVYETHVEPITKTLHVPTALAMVRRAAANPGSVSRPNECLLFAIYHFAVVAMTDEECREVTGRPHEDLRCRFHDAARQALINVHFLKTTDRVVLQAMAAQLCGVRVAVPYESWDTKQPLNANDDDLHPEMSEPPVERQGATDMIFCLARTELGKFHHRTQTHLGDLARLWESGDLDAIERVGAAIDELESDVESRFTRYCDFIEPIQCLTMALAKSAISGLRLRLRLPGAKSGVPTSSAEYRDLFKLAMKVLDYKIAVRTNAALSRYSWHLRALNQWEPLIWILNELRKGPNAVADYRGTWSKIESMYDSHPEFTTRKRALNVAVNKLTLKAWQTREAAEGVVVEPRFIADLKSSLFKRQGSRAEPTPPYNPWEPQHAELPMYIDPALAGTADATTTTTIDDFSPNSIDWMFWDQLIQDPESFAAL
ncbi:hypothetical protein LTR85_002470 [Meristemomyces frigidus]|nr:hypothetical protein LTR85_002470 [Meristemomyces frigidus]